MSDTVSEIEIFHIILLVALALIFSRLLGSLFNRFKQPPVIGEILAGFLLGGFGLGIIAGTSFSLSGWTVYIPSLPYTSESFTFLANLGILFLLFLSGLEIQFTELKKVQKSSLLVAIGGVVAPLILGLIIAFFFGFDLPVILVVGLILVATSVGVPVRVLMDLHVLNSRVGLTILGSAVIDDIVSIFLFVSVLGAATLIDIAFLGLKIIIFFVLFLFIGLNVIDKIFNFGEKIQLPKTLLSFSLAIFLLYSFFAYQSGIAGITGAFVAGVVIGHAMKSKKVVDDIKTVSYGFFIPLFFVWIGANVDPTVFGSVSLVVFALIFICVGIVGKIFGCSIGGKLAGFSNRESLQVGFGMIPRLEMALIIAGTAVSQGILEGVVADQILASTVMLTLVTTLLTPFLLKMAFTPKGKWWCES